MLVEQFIWIGNERMLENKNLVQLGEFGLIENIREKFADLLPANIFGIGDDCAVMPIDETSAYIISTDMLIEGVHFLRDAISTDELIWKALAVNLSDIAAMGGVPIAFLSSAALPKDIKPSVLMRANERLYQVAKQYDIANIGGDTTGSKKHIALSITIIGKMNKQEIKYRHSAQVDDIVCVTGNLGDSAAGLRCILNHDKESKERAALIEKHYHPIPRLEEGQFFAKCTGVRAMMDISDGIASDLQRIMKASHVGAEIFIENIPISSELTSYCGQHGLKTYQFSACGGEDYELLLTVAPESIKMVQQEFEARFNKPLYTVGKITAADKLVFTENAKILCLDEYGFKHF